MNLLKLAFCFFKIGLLSFGGGYSVLPMIEQCVVLENEWITYEQYADVIALSEITPGPISVNAASFTGYVSGGFPGAIAATVGCVLPSVLIVSILAAAYVRYRNAKTFSNTLAMLRPAVCAVIFASFVTIAALAFFGTSQLSEITVGSVEWRSVGIFIVALALLKMKKINPVFVIIAAGFAGLLLY